MAPKKNDNEGSSSKIVWTPSMDGVLLDALLGQYNLGNKVGSSFTSTAYANVVNELSKTFSISLEKSQVQGRWKILKAHFAEAWDIFNNTSLSGFSFDPEKEEKPKAKLYMNNPIPHYNKMVILYGKDRATEKRSATAKDMRKHLTSTASDDFTDFTNEVNPTMSRFSIQDARSFEVLIELARKQKKTVDKENDAGWAIKEAIDNVADAFRTSGDVVGKKPPIDATETFQLLVDLGFQPPLIHLIYSKLVMNADLLKAVVGCLMEMRKDYILSGVLGDLNGFGPAMMEPDALALTIKHCYKTTKNLQMVMDEERDGNGEDGGNETLEEEFEINTPTLPQEENNINVAEETVNLIESVARFGDYRRTQRKECYNLVRRMKTLLPFLDEIRYLDSPISDNAIVSLSKLKKQLRLAKKLLKSCNEGSKIYLALEGEATMIKFHAVYEKLSLILEELPFDELGISEEVKEQVELMQSQLYRAKRRTDTQDIELAVDLMVVSSKTDERNADIAIIERLAKKLDLHTVEDLKIESIAVKNLSRERGQNAESIQHIIELLNKFKNILGMEITNVLDDPVVPKTLVKSHSLRIPCEFLCPITLDIMSDPVIIASGQTYERKSIQTWFDSKHRTCPKTRQTLDHLLVAPNFALKNLISQWCEKNNFKLPKKEDPESSQGSSEDHKEEISSLVEQLSSTPLEVQRKAVKRIRLLSKENPGTRVLIAESGAIPPLVELLSYPDLRIQENAVTALLNLSIDEANKTLITNAEAIPAIIQVLQNGSVTSRENSAAALFSLSMLDENKVTIAQANGIPPLVDLLQNGTIRGKRDAASALFNLSLNQANKVRAIDAGIIQPLLELLEEKRVDMVNEALSIFYLLATHPEGRQEIGQLPFIKILVEIIQNGTPMNKECATSVLFELGSNNSSHILAALQFGVYEHLVEISQSGTNRAQRKATALLQLMSKSEQIP
ncbi:Armadillo [Corchorus capsularis]|uniref:RING-type E3 ubiquitin transferase n=1 Tax=Corchorus capsularis TaxID=210143 RepID=A0A1R3G250_COCAP|nr:Armadillo [Corchorus capsularis]